MTRNIEEITATVQQSSQFIPNMVQEMERIMVGQRYLIDRLILGLLTGATGLGFQWLSLPPPLPLPQRALSRRCSADSWDFPAIPRARAKDCPKHPSKTLTVDKRCRLLR